MGHFRLTNFSSRELKLWIYVTAIVLGVLVPAISVEPKASRSFIENGNVPAPIKYKIAAAAEPVIIAPIERVAFSDMDWEKIHTAPIESVPRPGRSSQTKPQDTPIAENKISSVRGKKAERLFHSIIFRAARLHQVDPAMVQAIIMAESSFNPNAISKKGAVGLMQLMPNTATELGVKDIFHPEHNINGGVLYFKKLLKKFRGNVKLALAAYNAGSRKVKQYQGVPPFKATRAYIEKVFKYYQHYKNLSADKDEQA